MTKNYNCHHYSYLPFIASDLLEPCKYCKDNKVIVTKQEQLKAEYQNFVIQWKINHSISKAPSFTSWKANYRNK